MRDQVVARKPGRGVRRQALRELTDAAQVSSALKAEITGGISAATERRDGLAHNLVGDLAIRRLPQPRRDASLPGVCEGVQRTLGASARLRLDDGYVAVALEPREARIHLPVRQRPRLRV